MTPLRALLLPLLFPGLLHAQTTAEVSSFSFNDGVHPTFSFLFEGTDTKYVEAYWRDELKKISAWVSTKKDLVAHGALVPRISSDTLVIYVKAEQRKNSANLTAHVAILTVDGFVGPSSDAKVFEEARAYVQQQSTALRRQLAEQELSLAERGLSKLKDELSDLERDKERAESSQEKSKQRAAEAVQEQESTRAEAERLGPNIARLQAELGDAPDKEGSKELSGLIRDKDRAESRNRRAHEEEADMHKKVAELDQELRKNAESQERKKEEISRQETLVSSLREKLSNIR
ncbi:MAG: hypothetical protein H6592_07430 [Flavobacteriales bacterium]|nr:hypothetical protein [Flavobacteriales bacterium]